MKNLKFLPAILMLVFCIFAVSMGVYALRPIGHHVGGTVDINLSNHSIKMQVSVSGTKNSDFVGVEDTLSTNTIINFGELEFDDNALEASDIEDIVIKFSITNLATYSTNQEMADRTIGVFFANSNTSFADEERAMAADVLVEDSFKSGATTAVSAKITSYAAILPQETREFYIIFSVENYSSISAIPFNYQLFIEDYVAETTTDGLVKLPVVQTTTASEISNLSATPLESDSDLFTTVTTSTITDKTSIVYLVMPSTVKTIEGNSFKSATNLKWVTLSKDMDTIGGSAFENCTNLTSLTIGKINGFSYNVFSYCEKLKHVYASSLDDWLNISGENYSGIVSDANLYFGGKKLKHLVVSGKDIPIGAFLDCGSLEKVEISNCTISQDAFCGCKNLREIYLENVNGIGLYAFDSCINLTKVELVNVRTIGGESFVNCVSLRYIYIPASVLYIGDSEDGAPFGRCSPELVIECEVAEKPDGWVSNWNYLSGTTAITNWAVTNSLDVVSVSDDVEVKVSVSGGKHDYNGLTTSVTDNQASVAFSELGFDATDATTVGMVKDVVVSVSVTNTANYSNNIQYANKAIGVCWIDSNASITGRVQASNVMTAENINNGGIELQVTPYSVVLPGETREIKLTYRLTNISSKDVEFMPNYKLFIEEYVPETTSDGLVKMPIIDSNNELIDSVGDSEFLYNTTAKYIAMPSTITTIADGGADEEIWGAFREATNLERISLSNNLYYIGDYAFQNCTKLNYIELNENLKTIGLWAFKGTVLEQINIPATVTAIKTDAFNIDSLLRVYVKDIKAWCNISFIDGTSKASSSANPMYYVYNRSGGGIYFDGIRKTDVILPDNVTVIRNYAFLRCMQFKSVYIPSSVTSMVGYPFLGCSQSGFELRCAVATVPATGWSASWNYYNSTKQIATVMEYTL